MRLGILALGYTDVWLSLDPLQRALLRALVEGIEQPFGASSREALAGVTGGTVPTVSRVQTAMKALERRRVVDTWNGRRIVADPALAAWVRERDAD